MHKVLETRAYLSSALQILGPSRDYFMPDFVEWTAGNLDDSAKLFLLLIQMSKS